MSNLTVMTDDRVLGSVAVYFVYYEQLWFGWNYTIYINIDAMFQ